jgi:thymidylate kinase
MLPLVRALVEALASEGVCYCHWKSTNALDRSYTGANDLDLLVRRADAQRFESVLHTLGFKEAVAARPLPGVLDFYGHAPESGWLVHLHAHYRLVVGDDLTKNYVLPLERVLLDASAAQDGGFPIPPPELELIVLVLRLTLKHAGWDAIAFRRGVVPGPAREELAYLQARVDRDRLYRYLEDCLPFVGRGLFDECERAAAPGAGVRRRAAAARALHGRLAADARRPRAADAAVAFWRQASGYVGLRPGKKRLARGGAVVAIVGADGAGKSTVVDGLHGWLARDVRAVRTHLGKPPRSPVTWAVGSGVRAASGVAKLTRRAPARGWRRAALLAVVTARDRYAAHAAARREAALGTVVVSDRYPLPQLRLMDGPRIGSVVTVPAGNRLGERLAGRERAYYEGLRPPDVLVVLRLDPEVAVARRADEEAEFVRTRNAEVYGADWSGTAAHVVDASRSAAEVLAEVKSIVWSEL